VRSSNPALRATAVVAVVAALSAGMATTAQAGKTSKGKPGSTTTTTTTTALSASAVRSVHDSVCPSVAEYTSCPGISVTVSNFGATGWTGNSSPANKTVSYNTYSSLSGSAWSALVAHEMGGHHDAWNEIVAKVGTTQAWTDYYDLDYFGEKWAEARYQAVKGTARDFTLSEGKEIYLDCAGPVAHGYNGYYLSGRGFSAGTQQVTFCQGAASVMSDAISKVRPA
jgi:hypothetical protein